MSSTDSSGQDGQGRTSAPKFNDLPIGTTVLAWPGTRDGRAILTTTRSEPWELPAGDRVVMVEGYAGGIALTHIEVMPPAEHPVTPTEETTEVVDEDRHPEDYCHRCHGPNISWFTPGAVWDPVMRADGEWKWQEIICPPCFVELAGGGTWHLIPGKHDGERWTSADERAALTANAKAEVDDLRARLAKVEAALIHTDPSQIGTSAGAWLDGETAMANRVRAALANPDAAGEGK